jgi:3-oxoacyl-[acyl-carrier protein] reductase
MSSDREGGAQPRAALVFGATGAIGQEICRRLIADGCFVYGVSRTQTSSSDLPPQKFQPINWDLSKSAPLLASKKLPPCHSVIWAQGANFNDSIYDFDASRHAQLYEANVIYILESLRQLLDAGLVSSGARLCVISSIWQDIARQNKLSYTVSKSALRGLVQSLAIDLGPKNILINAVLPGALDTPMTRANLSASQIDKIETETPLKSLPKFEDVCGLVSFLTSSQNTGVTGQFIAADRGYSHVRYI